MERGRKKERLGETGRGEEADKLATGNKGRKICEL